MDLSYLYTFKEVVKSGSYTKTGEQLGYAQSSVTTQIKKLEEYYQVKLFERAGQKMRMTHAGEQLYEYVKQVTQLMDEAEERISQGVNAGGILRLGTVESLAAYFITPYIKQLKFKHPKLKIQLESGLCPNLKQGVLERSFDLAIMLDHQIDHPDLASIPIRIEKMILAVPPSHKLTEEPVISVSQLSEETLILTEEGCAYRVLLENLLRDNSIQPNSIISFTSLEAIKQCVIDGLGVAVLPELTVSKEINDGTLSALSFDTEEMNLLIQIIFLKKKWLSPVIKQFMGMFAQLE
ncbi:LysR family transcriptional regulator [Halobacillus rhizosphaerae]|uniref:LysR family transcriptional regulator n=1 Tax=Halobacillus rhizosphaerae TaxID=3064889 RepID=UPI00398B90B9